MSQKASLLTKKELLSHQVSQTLAQTVELEWPQCCAAWRRSQGSLPFPQLLNSYFEILLNPEKGAVNRKGWASQLPGGESACLHDLGLPKESALHTGWVGPNVHPAPHLRTAGKLVLGVLPLSLKQRGFPGGMRMPPSYLLRVAPEQDGVGTPAQGSGCGEWRIENSDLAQTGKMQSPRPGRNGRASCRRAPPGQDGPWVR